jgi:hypothetical protein
MLALCLKGETKGNILGYKNNRIYKVKEKPRWNPAGAVSCKVGGIGDCPDNPDTRMHPVIGGDTGTGVLRLGVSTSLRLLRLPPRRVLYQNSR